jgi:hypothetical protein
MRSHLNPSLARQGVSLPREKLPLQGGCLSPAPPPLNSHDPGNGAPRGTDRTEDSPESRRVEGVPYGRRGPGGPVGEDDRPDRVVVAGDGSETRVSPPSGLARSDLRVVPLEGATGGSALEHDQVASFDRRGRECERATLPRWAGLPEYRPPAQQYVHGVSGPRGVFGTAPFRHCPEIRIVAQTGCW